MKIVTRKKEAARLYEMREQGEIERSRTHLCALGYGAIAVVHGSILRTPETAHDLDVIYSLPTEESELSSHYIYTGNQCRRGIKEELPDTFENIVAQWAWQKQLPNVPIDAQQAKDRSLIIPTPWGTKPLFEVIKHDKSGEFGDYEIKPMVINGLASALRGDVINPGSFEHWRRQSSGIKVQLGAMHDYPGIWVEDDQLEGVDAISKAISLHPEGRDLVRTLPLGEEIIQLADTGSRFIERYYGGFYDKEDPDPLYQQFDFDSGTISLKID